MYPKCWTHRPLPFWGFLRDFRLWRHLWRFVAGGYSEDAMSKKSNAFRVGKVQAYLRGHVWYLCYHKHGQRRRPRVDPDKEAAK